MPQELLIRDLPKPGSIIVGLSGVAIDSNGATHSFGYGPARADCDESNGNWSDRELLCWSAAG